MGGEPQRGDGSGRENGVGAQLADVADHYGGGAWLIDVPIVVLRALAGEIPRLEARRSLRRASEVAMGSGTLRKEDANALRRSWLRAAGDGAGVPAKRVVTAAELERATAELGIGFVKVEGDVDGSR